MDLTEGEQRLLQSYLALRPRPRGSWLVGVAVGALICVLAVLLRVTDVCPPVRPFFLLVMAAGLVAIEQAVSYRERGRIARIIQGYDQELRRAERRDEDQIDTI
jgi:hypothetical protein